MAKKQFVSNENARRYDHEICLSYLKKCEVIKLKDNVAFKKSK